MAIDGKIAKFTEQKGLLIKESQVTEMGTLAHKVAGAGRGGFLRFSICLVAAFLVYFAPVLTMAATASRLSRENTYEAILAEDPANAEALAGRLTELKSEGSYHEAASVLKAAAAAEKDGQKRAGLKVREARFLSWAKEYEQAIALYREVLVEYPELLSARKGLAAVLGWKGSYDEAIAEYKKVLKQNPGDTGARLGLARTLGWKGDYDGAIALYREVLGEDGTNTEARLGLGRTLWWSGDRKGAEKETRRVLAGEPENKEALDLDKKIRIQRGPKLSLDFIVSDDSDDNHLEIYRAGLYYSPLSRLELNLGGTQFEASRFNDRARAKSLWLRSAYKFSKKTSLRTRVALLSLDTPDNPTTEMTWGVSGRRVFSENFRGGLGYSHYVLLDTAQLIRNDIRVDDFSAYITGKLRFFDVTLGAGYGDYSDGNTRIGFFADISRSETYYGVLFTLGYRPEYRDFTKNLNSGYFDPSGYMAHTFYGRARGSIFDRRLEYDALAAGGVQSFSAKTESTMKFSLDVKWHITDNLTVRGGAKYARSALASASGFEYEEYKAGLDYQF
ncbi:MAG: tetratricopeptide repeat protein [Thermodesulfobacteriota bacterium]